MIIRKAIPSSDAFREPEAVGVHSNCTGSAGAAPSTLSARGDQCFEAMVRHGIRQKSGRADRHFGAALIRQAKLAARASGTAGPSAAPIPGLDDDADDLITGARAISAFVLGDTGNAGRKAVYYKFSIWKATRQGMPFVQFDNSNAICLSKRQYAAWLTAELKKSNLITE